jgi:hypothetical protein
VTPDLLYALAMLAVAALLFGGVRAILKHKDRKRGGLMIAAALVMLANVLINAWPV